MRSFFGHPPGLATLFFTEMWERFSYYGMRALLILFMTAGVADGGLGFDVGKAAAIYGTYTAAVYLLALPGGLIADRVLGLRRAVLLGGVIIMAGHICLAIPTLASFYAGLCCIVIGTGLLKPNVSALVGQLYTDETRRDAGYSLYYMGVNLGGFLAPLATGYLAQSPGFRGWLGRHGIPAETSWHWGFGLAAVGMFLGLVQYILGGRHLSGIGMRPLRSRDAARAKSPLTRWWPLGLGLLGVTAFVVSGVQVTPAGIADLFGVLIFVGAVGFFLWIFLGNQWTADERRRLVLIVVLFLAAGVFWSGSEQAGSTLNLFAQNQTRLSLGGWNFPASWLQSVNSLFVILLAPVFAWIWLRLGRRNPSSTAKFALGLGFLAVGFGVMLVAGSFAAAGAKVSPMWLVVTYLLHTVGELCLSPVGLSAMSGLAPARILGVTMGIWFLATSMGNYAAGRIAGFYRMETLPWLFGGMAVVTGVAAVGMVGMARRVRASATASTRITH